MCSSLEGIVIPKSVTDIQGSAFCACSSLNSITVEDGNTSYKSADGGLYSIDGSKLICYPAGKQTKTIECMLVALLHM